MIYKLTPERGVFFYDSKAARIKNPETEQGIKLSPTRNFIMLILIKRGYVSHKDFPKGYENLLVHMNKLREKLREVSMFKVAKSNGKREYLIQFEYEEIKL